MESEPAPSRVEPDVVRRSRTQNVGYLAPRELFDGKEDQRQARSFRQSGQRGIDLVPVVYAVTADRRILIPVDTVKSKSTARLRRLLNIELDPRCTLLVEHFDDDWSELWWVRLHGLAEIVDEPDLDDRSSLLGTKYPQYGAAGSVVGGISMTPSEITTWAAS